MAKQYYYPSCARKQTSLITLFIRQGKRAAIWLSEYLLRKDIKNYKLPVVRQQAIAREDIPLQPASAAQTIKAIKVDLGFSGRDYVFYCEAGTGTSVPWQQQQKKRAKVVPLYFLNYLCRNHVKLIW